MSLLKHKYYVDQMKVIESEGITQQDVNNLVKQGYLEKDIIGRPVYWGTVELMEGSTLGVVGETYNIAIVLSEEKNYKKCQISKNNTHICYAYFYEGYLYSKNPNWIYKFRFIWIKRNKKCISFTLMKLPTTN